MKDKTMLICFVDEIETIKPVITELRRQSIFEVRKYKDYSLVPEDMICSADLFVLDVWTGERQTSDAFINFVRRISKKTPFIAFTNAIEKSDIALPSGDSVRLREFVLANAGLCVVTKRDRSSERWGYEFRLDLLERILGLYWSTRD